jgi:hypothetical protein
MMASTNTFNEILQTLEDASHVNYILLVNQDGTESAVIENKPGSQGSIKVYYHLFKNWGRLSLEAARQGLLIYGEHTQDAIIHPGKHPNIDRLLAVIESNATLEIKIVG